MKSKKWLNYALSALLTLVVLTVVAGAGFRAGMTQNVALTRGMNGTRPSFVHDDFGGAPQGIQGNSHDSGKLQAISNDRGFDRRDGDFASPIFGLIRLAALGLLAWIGYTFVKKSGWKLSLAKTSPAPVPAASTDEIPSAEVAEEKESE